MKIRQMVSLCLVAFLSFCLMVSPAFAIEVFPGDRVVLRATNRQGVPLHETDTPSLVGRAADGTIAEVLEISDLNQWIKLKLPDGQERWVTERYIEEVVASDTAESPSVDESDAAGESDSSTESSSSGASSPTSGNSGTSFPGLLFPDLSGEALRTRLAEVFDVETSLGYRRARDYMFSELDNDNGIVRGIYSGFEQAVAPNSSAPRREAFQDGAGLNAEHSWPQSRGATGVAKSDLHHLFPAQVGVNSRRGSSPFAEIDDSQTRWWLIDKDQLTSIPTTDIDEYSEATRTAFEPREDVKGNIARAQFYFYTIYRDQADDGFFQQQKNFLCAWNEADPVDAQEQSRSRAIAVEQGNENPFVIDPNLADRLYCEG